MKKALKMITAGILIGLGSVMLPGCGNSNGTSTSVSQKAPQSDIDKYKAACIAMKQDYNKLTEVNKNFYEKHKNQKDKYPMVDYLKEYNALGLNNKNSQQIDAKVEKAIKTLSVDELINTMDMMDELKNLPEKKQLYADLKKNKDIYFAMKNKNQQNQKIINEMKKIHQEQGLPGQLGDLLIYPGGKIGTSAFHDLEQIALNKHRIPERMGEKVPDVSPDEWQRARKYTREKIKEMGLTPIPALEDHL